MKTYLLLLDDADGRYSGTVFAMIIRATSEESAKQAARAHGDYIEVVSCDEYTGEIEMRTSGQSVYG